VLTSLVLSLLAASVILQVTVFSTTIYLHRTATHRSVVLHPAIEVLFRIALWLTTGIKTREWVAVHRKHHAYTDKEGDPHSPLLAGFWSVQLGNIFHYVREARKLDVQEKYARDIEEDWWERTIFRYGLLGPIVGLAMLSAIIGPGWAVLAGTIHGVTYIFVLSSSINGLCHYRGYKNFDNTATNIRSLALITAGEGLHNNHHAFQRSPKFSFKASEFDPAWSVIWLLTKLGLAQPYKMIEKSEL